MRCFALDRSKPTEKHEGEGYRECPTVLTNWRYFCWILESHNVWKHIFWITRPGQPRGGIQKWENQLNGSHHWAVGASKIGGSHCSIAMFERYSTMTVTAGMYIKFESFDPFFPKQITLPPNCPTAPNCPTGSQRGWCPRAHQTIAEGMCVAAAWRNVRHGNFSAPVKSFRFACEDFWAHFSQSYSYIKKV